MKNQLVESVLVRWNYCKELKWPLLKDGLEKVPRKRDTSSYEVFPGVLIGVREPHIGKIIDFRDRSKSPCFDNLIRYESGEIEKFSQGGNKARIVILEDTTDV